MSNKKVNLAIQVLPMHTASVQETYAIVDSAIQIIRQSGLDYEVCPFETVLEGSYDDVMEVVDGLHKWAGRNGLQLLINMKLQINGKRDVRIEEKMIKYR